MLRKIKSNLKVWYSLIFKKFAVNNSQNIFKGINPIFPEK